MTQAGWLNPVCALQHQTWQLENYNLDALGIGTNSLWQLHSDFECVTGVEADDLLTRDSPHEHAKLHLPTEGRLADFNELVLRTRKYVRRVRSHPSYRALRSAYRMDDQRRVAKYAPTVFSFPETDPLLRGSMIFHGVNVGKLAVDEYVDLILRIQQQGLKPSPFDYHSGMDRWIRPIFCISRAEQTHGLIFFGFAPYAHGIAVFDNDYCTAGNERLVYTRRLAIPFEIFLKAPSHLAGYEDDHRPFGLGDDMPMNVGQLRRYRDELEDCIIRRGIDAIVHEAQEF